MTLLDREQILNTLQADWAAYVERYKSLPPDAQTAFLKAQGYRRFADLLSHIIAWWKVGYQAIEKYQVDPQFQGNVIDVDAFNADAVAKTGGMDEAQVIGSFEDMRNFLLEYVKALPDSAFENEKVVKQFNMELVGHLKEHSILQSA